ncbi:hypothetical protein LUD75_02295 [Epilithonimonas sp. JDS]|nr:hypothetical protein [Epilithonimonas sp. JDS]MCD9853520.1 hypothetical protein [Epilithonimonas sp. JDS]
MTLGIAEFSIGFSCSKVVGVLLVCHTSEMINPGKCSDTLVTISSFAM